ncbi:P-type conjugative transfer protein TrbL [Bartonella acomydis]|uniref:P-type conjugative transfer protein TrbL n=1 Tax=Bartonella acomydis TaxID=686234 RepID=UPI0031ED63FC
MDKTKSFSGLLDLIQDQSHRWYSKLHYYGFRLFWLLATLQLIISFIPLLFKQSDIADFLGELVKFILVIGFFAALLEYSQEWGTAIVESFRTAAADASGRDRNLFPSDILGEASDIMEVMANVSTWNPINSMLITIQSVIVFLCFSFIAVLLAVTLIESYIVINASVIFMGFGASQWTREISITIFRYTVSVGAKLFVMTLLVTLISDSMKAWKDAYVYSAASNWTLLGLSLLCAYLTKTIPEIISGLISGTSGGSGATIGAMVSAAVGAAVVAATAGAGAPAVAGGAAAAGGTGSALGGGESGGIETAGMSGGGVMTGAVNNINASQMTGNFFKDSGNKPQSVGNPRVAGGENRFTSTSQSQAKSISPEQSESVFPKTRDIADFPKTRDIADFSKTRDIADMTLKGAEHMATFCIPGMENAANLSLNAPPTSPEYNDIQIFNYNTPQSDEVRAGDMIVKTISGVKSTFGVKSTIDKNLKKL